MHFLHHAYDKAKLLCITTFLFQTFTHNSTIKLIHHNILISFLDQLRRSFFSENGEGTQPAFTCSKLTTETLEQGVK